MLRNEQFEKPLFTNSEVRPLSTDLGWVCENMAMPELVNLAMNSYLRGYSPFLVMV